MNQNAIQTAEQDLIYLVSCAVNQRDPDPQRCAAMDHAAVLLSAERHMLSAAAALALRKVIKLSPDWKEAMGKAMRKQIIFDLERQKLLQALEENGIWYLPLKGAVLKDYYPVTAMREMSDNDILCDPDKKAQIKQIMESTGFTCNDFGKTNHDVYQKDVLVFEIHSTLFNTMDFPAIYEYFLPVKERLVREDGSRFGYRMTAEDFYIYLICHMYKHYAKAGTGLRSLLDIYVYNKKAGQSLDREIVSRALGSLGIDTFEQKTRALAEKVFSFSEMSGDEQGELAYYIDSNCYGNSKNMAAFRLHNDDSKQAKRRYYFRRIFPDEAFLKNVYPTVYRHRFLYPFLVVYRPFKGVFTKRKKLLKEYKSIKDYQNEE